MFRGVQEAMKTRVGEVRVAEAEGGRDQSRSRKKIRRGSKRGGKW